MLFTFRKIGSPKLLHAFAGTSSHLSMCWLKAVGGGWTTSVRMHESVLLPRVFGCLECKDELRHYLTCPNLWQLAREALSLMETSLDVGHRLCYTKVNTNRVRFSGYCHTLYHHIRRSSECADADSYVKCSRFIQNFAVSLTRALVHLISD